MRTIHTMCRVKLCIKYCACNPVGVIEIFRAHRAELLDLVDLTAAQVGKHSSLMGAADGGSGS